MKSYLSDVSYHINRAIHGLARARKSRFLKGNTVAIAEYYQFSCDLEKLHSRIIRAYKTYVFTATYTTHETAREKKS